MIVCRLAQLLVARFKVLQHCHRPVLALLCFCLRPAANNCRAGDEHGFAAFVNPPSHVQAQVAAMGLQTRYIVGLAGYDLLGNRFLAAHGVDGDDAALDAQELEQRGDSRNFIGLLGRAHLHLPEQHALLGSLGANDMQRLPAGAARAAHAFAVNGHHALDAPGHLAEPLAPRLLRVLRCQSRETLWQKCRAMECRWAALKSGQTKLVWPGQTRPLRLSYRPRR